MAGCLPGVRPTGEPEQGEQYRIRKQCWERGGAPRAPAASEAESTCLETGRPAGRETALPGPCHHGGQRRAAPRFPRRQQSSGPGGFFGGVVFTPMVAPHTPAEGTERGDTVHVQCQTRRERKGTNLDHKIKKTTTTKTKPNPKTPLNNP